MRDRPARGAPACAGSGSAVPTKTPGGSETAHAQDSSAQRHSRAVERQRQRTRLARSDPRGQPGVRLERLQSHGPAPAAAEARLQGPAEDAGPRRGARHVARRRGGAGDEGLGDGEGRDPLHALVPAADGLDGREARLLLRPRGRRHGDRGVLRQGADPGRARRLLVSHRRHPGDIRGARLHRLGPDLAGVHPGEPQRRTAVHPDGVHVVDGRGARQQDPAAALDGRPLGRGHASAGAAGRRGRATGVHDDGLRAGVLPDRRAVLLRTARPRDDGAHAVRRETAEGSRARRPLLRVDPGARARVHARGRARAREAGRADQDAPQRGRAEPVRGRADLRELERRLRSPDADDADHAEHRQALRPGLPAAREAVRGRERLGQAQQLVDGHGHGPEPARARRHTVGELAVPVLLRRR